MERLDSRASVPGHGHACRRVCVIALALIAACAQPRAGHRGPGSTGAPVTTVAGAPARDPADVPAIARDPGPAPATESVPAVAADMSVAESPAIASSSTFCRRVDAGCWDCVAMAFPDEVPCDRDGPACNGICVASAQGRTCRPSQRACCTGGSCEQPPIAAACDAECGDPSGDGKNDRCIVPGSCPYKAQLADFFGHYRVRTPAALFEALCGPLPSAFPTDHGDGARARCGPDDVIWTIHPYTMSRGSGGGGPGVCYGVVRVDRVGQPLRRCGKHHCQTLRYCNGQERAEYCTVIAACDGGKVVPSGLTW
jgi:hypothetical protein